MQRSDQQQGTATYLLACVALLSLLLGGCRQRNNQASEEAAASPTPTATAVQMVAVPTFSPTPEPTATNSPVPTPLPGFNVNANASLRSGPGDDFDVADEIRAGERVMPTARSDDGNWVRLPQGWIRTDAIDDLPLSGLPIVVPTPNLVLATVNAEIGAYVRAGPGTTFRVVDRLEQGTPVVPIARTRDASWVQLENGWIFSQLLDKVPANLPTAQNVPPPPTPTPTATPPPTSTPAFTPTPTWTPDPRRETWDSPIQAGNFPEESFKDGLKIKLKGFVRDCDRMRIYLSIPAGGRCEEYLVIVLELVNSDGKEPEYVALQDFRLHKDLDKDIGSVTPCSSSAALSIGNNDTGIGGRPFSRLNTRPEEVHICFQDVEGTTSDISRDYILSYKPRFFYPEPTPTTDPDDSSRIVRTFTLEKNDSRYQGWTHYFELTVLQEQ